MSDLTAFEGRKLEKLLGMGSGYVLNFSDRTFSEFFIDLVNQTGSFIKERYRVTLLPH